MTVFLTCVARQRSPFNNKSDTRVGAYTRAQTPQQKRGKTPLHESSRVGYERRRRRGCSRFSFCQVPFGVPRLRAQEKKKKGGGEDHTG